MATLDLTFSGSSGPPREVGRRSTPTVPDLGGSDLRRARQPGANIYTRTSVWSTLWVVFSRKDLPAWPSLVVGCGLACSGLACSDDPAPPSRGIDAAVECVSAAVAPEGGIANTDAAAGGSCGPNQLCRRGRCYDMCVPGAGHCASNQRCGASGLCEDGEAVDAGATDSSSPDSSLPDLCVGVQCDGALCWKGECVECNLDDATACDLDGAVCNIARGSCAMTAGNTCDPCATDNECNDAQLCRRIDVAGEERVCVSACDAGECLRGFECNRLNLCVPIAQSCTLYRQALDQAECTEDASCIPLGVDTSDALCIPDEGTNVCRLPCMDDMNCPDPLQCIAGTCFPT